MQTEQKLAQSHTELRPNITQRSENNRGLNDVTQNMAKLSSHLQLCENEQDGVT